MCHVSYRPDSRLDPATNVVSSVLLWCPSPPIPNTHPCYNSRSFVSLGWLSSDSVAMSFFTPKQLHSQSSHPFPSFNTCPNIFDSSIFHVYLFIVIFCHLTYISLKLFRLPSIQLLLPKSNLCYLQTFCPTLCYKLLSSLPQMTVRYL